KLDLRKDFKDLYSYVVRRVRAFDLATNDGPGDGKSPVSQIDFGFQYDQDGWAALVFDTRPKAEPDGEWNEYIEENVLERPRWQAVFDALRKGPVDFTLPDGTTQNIKSDSGGKRCAKIFGDLLKSVLLKAREDGVFQSLLKAKRCHLGVEEHDG